MEVTRINDSYISVIWIVKVRVDMYGPILLSRRTDNFTAVFPLFGAFTLCSVDYGIYKIEMKDKLPECKY
jgi:hypothetical protein